MEHVYWYFVRCGWLCVCGCVVHIIMLCTAVCGGYCGQGSWYWLSTKRKYNCVSDRTLLERFSDMFKMSFQYTSFFDYFRPVFHLMWGTMPWEEQNTGCQE
jgi:hypothetical protein